VDAGFDEVQVELDELWAVRDESPKHARVGRLGGAVPRAALHPSLMVSL